jgi:hypothetical protein
VTLVDPEVTSRKLGRELELWDEHAESYQHRGWVMLRREPPVLEVAFLARLPIGGNVIAAIPACIQIDFINYDLWAPSVEFIDPITRQYAPPAVQALIEVAGGAQNVLVGGHPDTGRPFLCFPGIRQYHTHPQHTGDSWLLHRPGREGSLAMICERVWQTMARTLLGVQLQLQTLPGQMQLQLGLVSAPGEVAPAMWQQADTNQQGQATQQETPASIAPSAQMLAALGVPVPAQPAPQKQEPGP